MTSLPFIGDKYSVKRVNDYIVFESALVNVHYDGDSLLKVQTCIENNCSVCGARKQDALSYPYASLISSDSKCPMRRAIVSIPPTAAPGILG